MHKTISDKTILANYIPANENEIQIMTLHKSKGLEFDIVFHADLYDWILPGFEYMNDKNNKAAWMQDINLHYVGLTRAKKCCVLYSSSQRYNTYGELKKGQASCLLFLNNISELRK